MQETSSDRMEGEVDHGGGGGGPVPAAGCSSTVPPAPRRRDLWDPPPSEGLAEGVFTVEIRHGGFFCGVGTNRCYMDEKVDHFDYCQRENWCCQFIDDFVKELCYDLKDPKLAVYWLKQLADNGEYLVAVNSEQIARAMAEVSVSENPIVLYVDHVDFLAKQGSDDVSLSSACLPKVLSPRKGGYVNIIDGDDSEEKDNVEDGEEDSESDPDFADSDYDFEDDDGLFEANVDDKVADDLVHQPIQAYPRGEDDVTEEVDSHDPGGPKFKFSVHNPLTDKDNPVFKLGMKFPTVQDLRKALSMYCVNNRIQINKTRNNSKRLEAQCKEGCPWKLIASKDSRSESFLVKTYVQEHTCERVWKVKELTGALLTEEFLEEFRIDETMTLKSFANKVQQKYNMVNKKNKRKMQQCLTAHKNHPKFSACDRVMLKNLCCSFW